MPAAPLPSLTDPLTAPRAPRWLVAALLLAGTILFALGFDGRTHPQYLAVLLAAALAFIPSVGVHLARGIDRLRRPTPRIKWLTAAILFVCSARYFLLSASLAQRELYPRLHDEHMYLLQARMLAAGRLWYPPHALADFFESFYVIVQPVYAGSYFPGTALTYVPGMWLKLAPWATSVTIAGLGVAMTHLLFTELLDGVAGILGALLIVSLETFRGVAVAVMSHSAMMLLALLMVWSYTRWRRRGSAGWAVALGAFAGWAGITRPADALCFAAPIGIAVGLDLARLPAIRGRRAVTLGAALAALLPFMALQLALDRATTGHFLETPIAAYGRANFPGLDSPIGPGRPLSITPSALPQVHDFYAYFLRPKLAEYRNRSSIQTFFADRLAPTAHGALPASLLYLLLPIGLFGLADSRRIVLASAALLLPLAYTLFPVYLTHYAVPAAPSFILLVVLGARVLSGAFASRPAVSTALTLALAALAIGSLPELRGGRDPFLAAPYLADINDKLARLDHTPAIVIFRYESGVTNVNEVHEEPVYNIDAAWPDDAVVVRAQDLGEQNRRLFEYFARQTPARYVYVYDRTTAVLTPLGWVNDLARR